MTESYIDSDFTSIEQVVDQYDHQDPKEARTLNLHCNRISSLEHIHHFTNIEELNLSSNNLQLFDLNPLHSLHLLKKIDLSCNNIYKLSNSPILPSLRILSLAYNRISDLDELQDPVKFPNLQELDLRDNMISSMIGLSALRDLKMLTHLQLQDGECKTEANPICRLDIYPACLINILPSISYLDGIDATLQVEEEIPMKRYDEIRKKLNIRQNKSRDDSESALKKTTKKMKDVQQLERQIRLEQLETRLQCLETNKYIEMTKENRCNDEASRPENKIKTQQQGVKNYESSLFDPSVHTNRVMECKNVSLQYFEMLGLESGQEKLPGNKIDSKDAATNTSNEGMVVKSDAEKDTNTSDSTVLTLRAEKAEALVIKLSTQLMEEKRGMQKLLEEKQNNENTIAHEKGDTEREIKNFKKTIEDLRSSSKTYQDKLQDLKIRYNETCLTLEQIKRDHEQSTALVQRYEIERKERKDSFDEMRSTSLVYQDECKSLKESVEKMQQEALLYQKEILALKSVVDLKTSEIETIRMRNDERNHSHAHMIQKQKSLYNKNLEKAIAEMSEEIRHRKEIHTLKLAELRKQKTISERREERLKEFVRQTLKQTQSIKSLNSDLEEELRKEKIKFRALQHEQESQYSQQLASKSFQIYTLQQENERLKKELEGASKTLHEEEIQKLKDKETGLVKKMEEMRREREAVIKVKDVMLKDLGMQVNDLKKQLQKSASDIQQLQIRGEELEESLDKSMIALSKAENKNEDMRERNAHVRAALKRLEKENADLRTQEAEVGRIQEQLKAKKEALQYIEKELIRMRQLFSEQERKSDERLEKISRQHAKEQKQLEEMIVEERSQKEGLEKSLSLSSEAAKELSKELEAARKQVDSSERRVRSAEKEMKSLLLQIDRERSVKQQKLSQMQKLVDSLS